jgi:signal transduction histidine kinase
MPRLHLRFYFALLGSLLLFTAMALVLLHLDGAPDDCHRIHVLLTLPVMAVIVSVLAYPVARRLTSRVERLQLAVESLGAGDLSARVAVEGKDEVAHLADSFNRAASRIEELVGAHKRLLANASHELRTPLTRIRLATELIKDSADPQRRIGLEQDISELDHLIDEILLASRLDALVGSNDDEEVDLLGLAAEECSRYDQVCLEGCHVVLQGDPRLLRRLLRNLLENAHRHGIPPVEVRLTQQSNTIDIEVLDHGEAIPIEESARLFDPFYRRAETKNNVGVGLGLALVRQIAKRHGGDAGYKIMPTGKNCFFVSLPLKRVDTL